MRKILTVVVGAILIMALTACGGSNPIKGVWGFNHNGSSSMVRFSGEDKVVWTFESSENKWTYEGTYFYDEENEEVTVYLEGWGSGTYDVDLDIPQIDFMGLAHRR